MHEAFENNLVVLTIYAYCDHCKTIDKKEYYIRRFKSIEHCLTWIMTYSLKNVANMVIELENPVTSSNMYDMFSRTEYATYTDKRRVGLDQKLKYVKVKKFLKDDQSCLFLHPAKKNFPYYPNFLI